MSGKVTKAGQFDLNKIKFADNIRTNKYSGKSVYVNYDNGPFRIQMPKMSLPFGISVYKNPESGEEKFSLELSWAGVDPKILENFKNFEQKILDYAEKNSKELFKKQKQRVVLEELQQSYLKIDKDEDGNVLDKYAPRLKAKLYTDRDTFSVTAFDAQKKDGEYQKVTITKDNVEDYLSKGSKCETILQCSGLWVVDQKFGVSWVVVQMKIHQNENKLIGYSFEDVDETGDDFTLEDLEIEEEPTEQEEPQVEEQSKERKPRRKREYL
jgi:hypothetical protein